MSLILNEAVIKSLKYAHEAYLRLDRDEFEYHIKVAENAIQAIRALGHDPGRGRELEVLNLTGEKNLVYAFVFIGQPEKMLEAYETAESQLLVPPSQVLSKKTPFLPPRPEIFATIMPPAEDSATAELAFSQAVAIYGRLTGGGGAGADRLYSALIAHRQGDRLKAAELLTQANKIGGEWITPHTEILSKIINQEEKQ